MRIPGENPHRLVHSSDRHTRGQSSERLYVALVTFAYVLYDFVDKRQGLGDETKVTWPPDGDIIANVFSRIPFFSVPPQSGQ